MSDSISSDYVVDTNSQTCNSIDLSQGSSWWKLDMILQRKIETIEFSYKTIFENISYFIYVTNSTIFDDIDTSKSLCITENLDLNKINQTKQVLCDRILFGRFVYFSFTQDKISLCNVEIIEAKCSNCIAGSFIESGYNKYADCQCPRGSFRDEGQCQLCTKGKNTNTSHAISQSDCAICDIGYDAKDPNCHRCDIGFLKNKATHNCDQCPEYTFNNYAGEDRCFDCFSGGIRFFERCLKAKTDHVSCPKLCQSYPGYQVTGMNIGNLEKCPIGFFNNDNTKTIRQPCGEASTTNSSGSTKKSQCNICTFRYTGPQCLECVSGYSSFFSNEFCRILSGVNVFVRVVVIVSGDLNANTTTDTINAFAKVADFKKTLVTKLEDVPQRRTMNVGNSAVKAEKRNNF